jgi:hypothetical protein
MILGQHANYTEPILKNPDVTRAKISSWILNGLAYSCSEIRNDQPNRTVPHPQRHHVLLGR